MDDEITDFLFVFCFFFGLVYSFIPSEISVAGVQQLTNIVDVERILQETLIQEERNGKQLMQFMDQRKYELEGKLETIEVLPSKLRPVFQHVKELAQKVDHTCELADNVSKKVKMLDQTRLRLHNTQKRVEDILEVKNCIDGIDNAMNTENWERAAELFKSFLLIVSQEKEQQNVSDPNSQKLENSKERKKIQVLDKNSAEILQKKLEKFKEILQKKTEQANEEAEVKRFCKLFTPLGLPEQGLKKYISYLNSNLKLTIDDNYLLLRKSLEGKIKNEDEKINCVDCLTNLFETIAGALQTQIPIILESFGETSIQTYLKEIQQLVDVSAPRVIDRFRELYKISDIFKEVLNLSKKANLPPARGSENLKKIDPIELEEILDAVAMISQRTELYNRFLQKKIQSVSTSELKM